MADTSTAEIKELRTQLDKAVADSDFENAVALLKAISLLEIDLDILKETGIGKSVGILRFHQHNDLRKESTTIILKWKALTGKSTTTTTTTTTDTTPQTNPSTKRKSETVIKDKTVSNSPSNNNRKKSKDTVKVREDKDVDPPKLTSSSSSAISPSLSSSGGGSTGDTDRDKMGKLICDALSLNYEEGTNYEPKEVSLQIESELFQIHMGTTQLYKQKLRSFIFNLKNNTLLREGLLSGSITPQKFANMDSNDMANKELQEERKRIEKYNLEAAMDKNNNESTTDQFQCGKCKQRKCKYYQLQIRSADEPMTTFVTCVNCNHKWKFC